MMCLSFNSKEAYNKLQSYLKEHGEFKFTEETSDKGNLYYPEYIIRGELPSSEPSKFLCSNYLDAKLFTGCYTKTENYEIRNVSQEIKESCEKFGLSIDDFYYERYNS